MDPQARRARLSLRPMEPRTFCPCKSVRRGRAAPQDGLGGSGGGPTAQGAASRRTVGRPPKPRRRSKARRNLALQDAPRVLQAPDDEGAGVCGGGRGRPPAQEELGGEGSAHDE
eukprot:7711987-Alexandrium_andersonii.AAC.1